MGTDDGNLQVTRDGGKTWTNVVGNVPGLPKNTWVSSVEAGRFAEGTAYATFDGHMVGRHEDVRLPDDRLREDLGVAGHRRTSRATPTW